MRNLIQYDRFFTFKGHKSLQCGSVKDSSNGAFIMSTAILPGKFDDGDFDAWLREFDACSTANGWKVTEASEAKILKLSAFLRGRAASNFYAIPEAKTSSLSLNSEL
jgi:hypothetical protein